LAASYVNLVTPGTKDLTTTSAPTFDTASGWAFDGSANFLSTNTVIVNNQQWSFICRFSDTVAKASGVMGIAQGGYYALQPKRASGTERGYWAGDFLGFSPAMTSGVMCVAGNKPYKDGLAETGTIATAAGTIIYSMRLGGWTGGSETFYQCKIQAAAIYNTPLSAAQVLAVSTAMAAI
jgi:hypothetical protein